MMSSVAKGVPAREAGRPLQNPVSASAGPIVSRATYPRNADPRETPCRSLTAPSGS